MFGSIIELNSNLHRNFDQVPVIGARSIVGFDFGSFITQNINRPDPRNGKINLLYRLFLHCTILELTLTADIINNYLLALFGFVYIILNVVSIIHNIICLYMYL